MRALGVTLAIAIGSLVPSGRATAGTVTVEFSGMVLADELQLPASLVGSLAAGSPVTGRYTYDDARPDQNSFPEVGNYAYPEPQYFLQMVLGSLALSSDLPFVTPHLIITITNRDGLDAIDVEGVGFVQTGAVSMHLYLENRTTSVFDSDALPAQLPPLSAFEDPGGYLVGIAQPEPFNVRYSVGEWHVVPEPASLALCALALLALSGVRSRA